MSDELRPESAEEAVFDADELIAELKEPRFGRYLVLATCVVVAIVLLGSIRYFYLCSKYQTWDPRAAIKQENETRRQQEAEAKREERRRMAGAGKQGKAPADPKAGAEGKTPIEKELDETTTKRPTESDVSLDKDLGLE